MESQKSLMQKAFISLILLLFVLLSGCAGSIKNMREVPASEVHITPQPGKAMIVFMRPSSIGFAVQSSVFNVSGEEPQLVGIVAAKKKVAYQVEPGKYTFMTVGESADFMSAEVLANKTYYAKVTPRMGAWKARFSLAPVRKTELGSKQFEQWNNGCQLVETNADSQKWAEENMENIKSKKVRYMVKWLNKPVAERPALLPGDAQ
ncbi:MAG: hypothetical protein ABFS08_08295 [Pseudomonadota bacterium]